MRVLGVMNYAQPESRELCSAHSFEKFTLDPAVNLTLTVNMAITFS